MAENSRTTTESMTLGVAKCSFVNIEKAQPNWKSV